MPAESLRQRAARHVAPERVFWTAAEWALKCPAPAEANVTAEAIVAGLQPERDEAFAKASEIIALFLPLLREAGEGLEPFAKAIATADETYPSPTHYDDWLNVMRHQVASEAFRSARAIHAKIMELIDAE